MGFIPPPPPLSRKEFRAAKEAGARTIFEIDPALAKWCGWLTKWRFNFKRGVDYDIYKQSM